MSKKERLYKKIFFSKNIPYVNFLLGTFYNENKSSDRRNVLLKYLNSEKRYNTYNFIIEKIDFDKISKKYNIDHNVFGFEDYKVYEQLIAEISDNIFVFLDSISSSFEFGMFTMAFKSSLKMFILIPEGNRKFTIPEFIEKGPIKFLEKLKSKNEYKSLSLAEYKYKLGKDNHKEFNKNIKFIYIKNNELDLKTKKNISERLSEYYDKRVLNGEIRLLIESIIDDKKNEKINFELSINLLFKLICKVLDDYGFYKNLISDLNSSISIEFQEIATTKIIESFFNFFRYNFNLFGIKIFNMFKVDIKSTIAFDELNIQSKNLSKDLEYLESKGIFMDKITFWKFKITLITVLLFRSEQKLKNMDMLKFLIHQDKNKFLLGKKPESEMMDYKYFSFGAIAEKLCQFLGLKNNNKNKNILFNVFRGYNSFYKKITLKSNKKGLTYSDTKEAKEIKNFHKIFLKKLYERIKLNKNCFSYIKGKNIYQAVRRHQKSKIFLKIDIKSFFPSINLYFLFEKLKNNKNFYKAELYRDMFYKLFSDDKKGLPIGLVCSGYLSNFYLKDFDIEVSNKINSLNKKIVYTRYADDILISSESKNDFINLEKIKEFITQKLKVLNLNINDKKTTFIDLNEKNHIKYLGLNITNKNNVTTGKSFKLKFYITFLNFILKYNEMKQYKISEYKIKLKGYYLHIKNAEKIKHKEIAKDFIFYYEKILKYKLNYEKKYLSLFGKKINKKILNKKFDYFLNIKNKKGCE